VYTNSKEGMINMIVCFGILPRLKRGITMILVNTDYITGKEFDMLGLVQGATIQSKHIGKDIGAGFKSLVGGELAGYTEMMIEARNIATERMIQMAEKLGADAVINVRFTTSAVTPGAAEVMAYGTAVKFR